MNWAVSVRENLFLLYHQNTCLLPYARSSCISMILPGEHLHSENTKLRSTSLDIVPASHRGVQSQAQVSPGMLWWNDTVILDPNVSNP